MTQEKQEQFMGKLLEASYVPSYTDEKGKEKVVHKDGKFSRVVKYTDIIKVMQEFNEKESN